MPFFGQPAYTMTLLGRMARSTDATVLLFYGERLPFGRGYRVHIQPLQAISVERPSPMRPAQS